MRHKVDVNLREFGPRVPDGIGARHRSWTVDKLAIKLYQGLPSLRLKKLEMPACTVRRYVFQTGTGQRQSDHIRCHMAPRYDGKELHFSFGSLGQGLS